LLSKRKENPPGEVEKVLEKSRKTLETEYNYYNDIAYLKHHLESIDRKIDVLLENPLINAATVPLLAC